MSKVLIEADELRELLLSRYELQMLENGGVDNWCGYCESRSGEYSGEISVSEYEEKLGNLADEDLAGYV